MTTNEETKVLLLGDRLKQVTERPATRANRTKIRDCADDLAELCDDKNYPLDVMRDGYLLAQILERPATEETTTKARRLASQIAAELNAAA